MVVVAPFVLGPVASAITREPVPMRLRMERSVAFILGLAVVWLFKYLLYS
jgi:hypothetical protein